MNHLRWLGKLSELVESLRKAKMDAEYWEDTPLDLRPLCRYNIEESPKILQAARDAVLDFLTQES